MVRPRRYRWPSNGAESPVWDDLLRAILPDMRLELTRRGDCAVRAMLSLAGEDEGRRLSARRIAERMDIPPRFLPQVMRDLATAGLVVAYEGRAGGYRLARPPGTISLLDVIGAVERDERLRACVLRGGSCAADGTCAVHDVFVSARAAITERLASATLASLSTRIGRTGPDAVPPVASEWAGR